jgi:hypothetical protein
MDVRADDAFGAFSCVTDDEQQAVRKVSMGHAPSPKSK